MNLLHTLPCLLLATITQVHPLKTPWQLLIPGKYHSGEAPTKPGNDWLALVSADGVWRLESAVVRATMVRDEVLDGEGKKTGVAISSNHRNALALLKFENLSTGKVDTPPMKFLNNPRMLLTEDARLDITFNGEKYSIYPKKPNFYLKKGNSRTRLDGLYFMPGTDNSSWLLWAGDLDRDGKLDLLFGYEGPNSLGARLYLSACAGHGKLIKHVAWHEGIGC